MNEEQRQKAADNLTAMADFWSIADIEYLLGVLRAIHRQRREAFVAAAAAQRAVESRTHS